MRSFQITQVNPEHSKCPYKRQERKDAWRKGHVTTEQRLEGCGHKPRDAWSPQRLEEQEGPALEPWASLISDSACGQ